MEHKLNHPNNTIQFTIVSKKGVLAVSMCVLAVSMCAVSCVPQDPMLLLPDTRLACYQAFKAACELMSTVKLVFSCV
jgi:hypothetical protein